jgi:hypothetical protein
LGLCPILNWLRSRCRIAASPHLSLGTRLRSFLTSVRRPAATDITDPCSVPVNSWPENHRHYSRIRTSQPRMPRSQLRGARHFLCGCSGACSGRPLLDRVVFLLAVSYQAAPSLAALGGCGPWVAAAKVQAPASRYRVGLLSRVWGRRYTAASFPVTSGRGCVFVLLRCCQVGECAGFRSSAGDSANAEYSDLTMCPNRHPTVYSH